MVQCFVGTRFFPPRRSNQPILMVALASIDSRRVVGSASARSLTTAISAKMAVVSGIFFEVKFWQVASGYILSG
jgi:hypothetical protein